MHFSRIFSVKSRSFCLTVKRSANVEVSTPRSSLIRSIGGNSLNLRNGVLFFWPTGVREMRKGWKAHTASSCVIKRHEKGTTKKALRNETVRIVLYRFARKCDRNHNQTLKVMARLRERKGKVNIPTSRPNHLTRV